MTPLTMEQKQALQQFVRVHGNRGWKQAARRLWARAIAFETYERSSCAVAQVVYALRWRMRGVGTSRSCHAKSFFANAAMKNTPSVCL
ncbi:MAG: hypothetical protein EPN91_08690 [Salinibacterium sp.]|nr:MAG: hypothetical protein EPN91_08690 [Salinibacterium sp.]